LAQTQPWLSLGQGQNIGPQNSKGSTEYYRQNTKILKLFSLSYEQKVVVLKSKAVINFKIIQGVDIFSQAAEICAGLADNFNQELATLGWLRGCVPLTLGLCLPGRASLDSAFSRSICRPLEPGIAS
jgi:hypothetical protein